MKVAVLTYPGHFFLTQLCVRSLPTLFAGQAFETVLVYDDLAANNWPNYKQDLEEIFPDSTLIAYSSLPALEKVSVGWWRQQLVKLHIDKILSGDEWLLVDGDVIFDTKINVRVIPVCRFNNDSITIMATRYVSDLLGIDHPFITVDDRPYLTNNVPWRFVDRNLLERLREHIAQRYPGDLVDLHAGWFLDQTIVANWPEPMRWSMCEWDLLENFRYHILKSDLPVSVTGSYNHDRDPKSLATPTFRHGYKKDQELGAQWFESQNLNICPELWQKSKHWHDNKPR